MYEKYKMRETLDGTGHAIAEQLVRTLMFNRDPDFAANLRTIDQICNIIDRDYSPQVSPTGTKDFVTYHYKAWLKHFIMMRNMVGNKELQKRTWGHDEHFTLKDFKEMCPDFEGVAWAEEEFDKFQEVYNSKSGTYDEYGNICEFPDPV